MAKLKPRPQPRSARSRVAPDVTIDLDAVIDAVPRPGRDDPARDAVWLELRARIGMAEHMTTFDPRHGLALEGAARAQWQWAHRRWAADLLAGDPRVQIGEA